VSSFIKGPVISHATILILSAERKKKLVNTYFVINQLTVHDKKNKHCNLSQKRGKEITEVPSASSNDTKQEFDKRDHPKCGSRERGSWVGTEKNDYQLRVARRNGEF
jgi:hypothetical protein